MTAQKKSEPKDDRYDIAFQNYKKTGKSGRYDFNDEVIKTIETAIANSKNGTVKISLEDFKQLIGYSGEVTNIGRFAWYVSRQYLKPKGLFVGAIKSQNSVYLSKI